MTEIVINTRHSAFSLSKLGRDHYKKLAKLDEPPDDYYIPRDDPRLVQTVRDLGKDAYGYLTELKIVAIPDDVDWLIEEFDGCEHIAEKGRTWF